MEDCRKVYELELHGKKHTRIEGLDKFTSLRVLDMSCNELGKIEGLSKNHDLRELKLYGNRIASLGGLESLSELCHLQLQHNCVKKLGKALCNLRKLRILRLDHNQLEVISSNEIAPCGGHMTHLDLTCNRLTAVDGLATMFNLEELKLASNRFSELPDLSRCKKLTELDISSNPLHPGVLLKLKNKQLKVLRVEKLNMENIAVYLPKLYQLEELYAAGNSLSSTEDVPGHYPSLEVLDVRGNRIEDVGSLKALNRLQCLAELQLESNPLCSKMENYRADVRELLPHLELIDGVSLAAHLATRTERAVPLMRPMTPASIGPSLHQIRHQLMEAEVQLENYTSGLSASFEMMRQQLMAPSMSPSLVHHHTHVQPSQTRLCQTTLPREEEMDCSSDDSREKGKSSECSRERHQLQPVAKHQSQSTISLVVVQEKQLDLSSTSVKERSSDDGVELVRQQYVAPAVPPSSVWHNQPPSQEDLEEGGPHQTATPSSSLAQDEKELNLTKSNNSREEENSSGCGSGGGGCCDVVHGSQSGEGRGEAFPPPSCDSRPSTRGSSRARIQEALAFANENFSGTLQL